jgi:hypothetical protein
MIILEVVISMDCLSTNILDFKLTISFLSRNPHNFTSCLLLIIMLLLIPLITLLAVKEKVTILSKGAYIKAADQAIMT